MNIPACQVVVGDFLPGFGVVKSVRVFQGAKSVLGKTTTPEKEDYASQISSELGACYSNDESRIVLEMTMGSRSCLRTDSVEVIRFTSMKIKSEAA